MDRISDWPPFCYKEDNHKLIKEDELIAYYTSDVYAEGIDFTSQTMHFLRTDLNTWDGVLQYVEDRNGYLVFEYYKELKPIQFSKLMTNKNLKDSMVALLKTLYEQTINSKFVYNAADYYFMPVNNWLQNYMYNPKTNEVKMVDVDSFEVVEESAINEILRIYYNGRYYL